MKFPGLRLLIAGLLIGAGLTTLVSPVTAWTLIGGFLVVSVGGAAAHAITGARRLRRRVREAFLIDGRVNTPDEFDTLVGRFGLHDTVTLLLQRKPPRNPEMF